MNIVYKPLHELETGLDYIKGSPSQTGSLRLIVARPEIDQRKVLSTGNLDTEQGLIGDNWATRGSSKTDDGSAHPEMQINIMNARCIEVITHDKEYWQLAGDQMYVDFNLSKDNIPPGTRIAIGDAELEITSIPHTGCKKFSERFGVDALKFISSAEGKKLQLRGVNARVVKSGTINAGDQVIKLA